MPSDAGAREQRLHPAAILFDFARHLRTFAFPALLVLFSSSRRGPEAWGVPGVPAGWEAAVGLLLVPATLLSLARWLSYRIRYAEHELVISQGLLFRRQRHLPYARIHNLDATQNLAHRLLGVVEVRVETAGGGAEPEAAIRVLPAAAFEDMRRHVFAGRTPAAGAAGAPGAPATAAGDEDAAAPTVPSAPAEQTLLHLGPGELMLHGLLEGRGLVVVGAAYGALWELGVVNRLWDLVPGAGDYGRGLVGTLLGGLFGGEPVPLGLALLALAGFAAFLLFVRLISMVWAVVRLYDYRVTRSGDDLRTAFGLFTRVTATVPLHRVQTLAVREGPLQRLFGRASLRIETAGSAVEGEGRRERAWLAPIVSRAALPRLAGEVLPGLDLGALEWRPVDPRAFRRAVKPALAFALLATALAAGPFGARALALLPFAVLAAVVHARRRVARLAWALTPDAVALRSGVLVHHVAVARTAKIQAVERRESPFDRRARMARLRVDTAGARDGQRVDIPYLGRETAQRLHAHLAAEASRSAFRW